MNRIGIATAHSETLTPGARAFRKFFVELGATGRTISVLAAPLSPDSLAACDALLVGGPTRPLHPDEIAAVEAWVARGGHALVIGPGVSFLGGTLGFSEEPFGALQPLGPLERLYKTPRHVIGTSLEPLTGERGIARVVNGHAVRTKDVPARALVAGTERAFAAVAHGKGSFLLFASRESFDDEELARANARFLGWLLLEWLPGDHDAREVEQRLARPQRHRLLHGFPMSPLMKPLDGRRSFRLWSFESLASRAEVRSERRLNVGVLPHTFCNPQVRGCGFCTFPHETGPAKTIDRTVASVVKELEGQGARETRPVDAVYFGGGTANLAPPGAFRSLLRALKKRYDIANAEVTLEGVPAYFTSTTPTLLEVMKEELPATARPRISMGIQTFDPAWLAKMGRTNFGDAASIEKLVQQAKNLGFTVSGDFLVNLPGQSRELMLNDVERARAIGLDQACFYHLVLHEGLGTPWSEDAELLALRNSNETACANWLAVRDRLRESSWVQATLTNFERAEVHSSERRFVYETQGWQPDLYDVQGFGPGALSFQGGAFPRSSIKFQNCEKASDYVAALERGAPPEESFFVFGPRELRVLAATRGLAAMRIDRARWKTAFGTELADDFPRELAALEKAGLVAISSESVALTDRGTFYADTVAGVLAWRRVALMRTIDRCEGERAARIAHDEDLNAATRGAMG